MIADPQEYLRSISNIPDVQINLAETALALAAAVHPPVSSEKYLHHLKKLSTEVGTRHTELLSSGAQDDAHTRLAALKHVLSDKHGYTGDRESYDDLQNASLIRVIDRGKGLPITLCILYIHTAQAQGWDIAGLGVPGHFLCRLDHQGRRLIFDPFNQCDILEAPDLRALVKKIAGPEAELSAHYFQPATNREILIRLQNNIKYRQIEAEDYKGALKTVEVMRLIDPAEYRLLLDAGVLYARTDQPLAALSALEDYMQKAPSARDRQEAAILIREIRATLN